MASQQHVVMRQILEVRGCAAEHAQAVQSELRRVYYRHLLPSIEKACSRLGTPGRIHRIDRLEIDLGDVPLDRFEAALAEKFDDAFARELGAAIESGGSAEVDSELELFGYFVRTGTLPWWAQRSDPRLLDTSLQALIGRAPRALCEALRNVPDHERAWRRVALAFSDRLLEALVGVLTPSIAAAYPGFGAQWAALLELAAGAAGYSKPVARNLWWEALLQASGAATAAVSEAAHFFGAIVLRLSHRMGLDYRSLVARLHGSLDHAALSMQPPMREVVESLHTGAAGGSAGAGEQTGARAAEREELARLLAHFERTDRLDDDGRLRFSALLARLPAAERTQAWAKLRRTPAGAAWLRKTAEPLEAKERSDAVSASACGESGPAPPADLLFSDAAAIYVENAGLVVLWPFLESFFAHLGLTEDRQFKDSASVQRAVGLLQYLAAEEASAPEYLVPLNKVLCGMPPEEVFDFGPPITPAEIEACTELLTAAIDHAPILHDMSIGGFRGGFLLREGQLSVRDGHWLLRVQRETHDIVLDRFPWSARIVKLPWMAAAMQVEW
jgi:Contractile injection system tape measure protein